MTKQERFEKLQERFRKASEKTSDLRFRLKYHYGEVWQAPRGKQAQLERATAAEEKAQDAIYAWLESNSPRDWRTGPPYYWVCTELTYADAITDGPLSVVPPTSYGQYESDARRFALAVA